MLTFLSGAEIQEQVGILSERLFGEMPPMDLSSIPKAIGACDRVIADEGGESKSDRAKQAAALKYLLQGWTENQTHISPNQNRTMAMEEFNFANLQEAASYARRGSNSAVLKRVEYYCHHDLLKDGNVLVDTPGIDAPVKRDVALTYIKISDPDTAAVGCVLKTASAGDLTTEETELLEKTKHSPGIRDRVFYVFNRVDESWYNGQLADRLARLISSQFRDTSRVYKTSGLLGFYGGQIRATGMANRFGLDSIFAGDSTPQFVNEFNRYSASSGRLPIDRFRVDVRSYESPQENYLRILGAEGEALGQLVTRLDELVAGFSVGMVHERAQGSHRRNSVVPLLGILAEAFYYLANGLEDTLVEASQSLVNEFFDQLRDRISQQDYYPEVNRLLGHDGGIEDMLMEGRSVALLALGNAAQVECDRYVRECESFFAEGTASMFQLRETLAQACRGFDYSNRVESEPAIRQLLKLDFEQKVKVTVLRTFRQTINQTLNSVLLERSKLLATSMSDRYDEARSFLSDVLRQEAEEQVAARDRLLAEVMEKMESFDDAIEVIR